MESLTGGQFDHKEKREGSRTDEDSSNARKGLVKGGRPGSAIS